MKDDTESDNGIEKVSDEEQMKLKNKAPLQKRVVLC